MLHSNTFNKNYAGISGGALYWDDVEPGQLYSDSYLNSANKAKIYGDDIGTYT